jgi:L-lactate dehydrogenase complex protein LldG
MSADARSEILRAVRAARPPSVAAPDVRAATRGFSPPGDDLVARFATAARGAGARVVHTRRDELDVTLHALTRDARRVLSTLSRVDGSVTPTDARLLHDLELYVSESELGVAESGAVWLDGSHSGERAALFLAMHVVIVLATSSLVADLHAAYARLDIAAHAFGIFIAGPSKTADIEQALVIGAQGPKALTIVLRADGG